MDHAGKNEKIRNTMLMLKSLFNPKKAKGSMDFQFTFHEQEGNFDSYFSIRKGVCTLEDGLSTHPEFHIHTDLETWTKISGGYLSGMEAMKGPSFKVEGNLLSFLLKFKRIFSGHTHYILPENRYSKPYYPEEIKRVLVLSCSPRTSRGATHYLTEKLIEGMEQAGAAVDVLFPASMNIHPCVGCFQCFLKDTDECVYQDDMNIISEKLGNCDLLLWATPIYLYSCTTAMKIVMDRLFCRSDPHFVMLKDKLSHPKKKKISYYQALFATAGLCDMDVFEPLHRLFHIYGVHTGFKLISEIFRPSAMTFLMDDVQNIKKDKAIEGLIQGGRELVLKKSISRATKKEIERTLYPTEMFMATGNYRVDRMLEDQKFTYIRSS